MNNTVKIGVLSLTMFLITVELACIRRSYVTISKSFLVKFLAMLLMETTTILGVCPNCPIHSFLGQNNSITYNVFIISCTSVFNEAKFREILLPSSGSLDYVLHIFIPFLN